MADDKIEFEPERLTKIDFTIQVIRGIAVALGLTLLWTMEAVRDRFFRLLDHMGVPSIRWRKASAFPPGPAQK
ncbi:MAG: hypothetical protein ABSD31_03840 [Candidatus Binataceae bacterium]|jgi:hypothetical protein